MRFAAPLLSALLVLAAPTLAQGRLLRAEDLPGRRAAAADLQELLRGDADLPTTVALAAFAGRSLAAGSQARLQLERALVAANAADEPRRARAALRVALGDLVDTLVFQPRQEAELPVGFPGFGAVDELELRDYPAYRMVRTAMGRGSNSAFWPLFRHIESNGIAMTTPVQMDWHGADAAGRPKTMAFLYGDPAIEPKRVDSGVEVVAVPAQTVLSIGAIGDDRRDRVEALRERLLAFVAATGGAYEIAGELRTMGYNSPMVPRDQRYFEVQLPVRRRHRDAL